MKTRLRGWLGALLGLALIPPAQTLAAPAPTLAPTPQAARGVFVLIDPYAASDMNFLRCAAGAATGNGCNVLAAHGTAFSNPFVAGAASGIFLRVPWCGFQTDNGGPALTGSCHYGVVTPSGGSQAPGQYQTGKIGGVAQLHVRRLRAPITDHTIDNLSACATAFDTCSTSVLDQALGYIAQIQTLAGRRLSLSVGIAAGEYTPISVLDSAGYLDTPYQHGGTVTCNRQPLPWVAAYTAAYQAAVDALVTRIAGNPGLPPIGILKAAPLTNGTIEFSVPGGTTLIATARDPLSVLGTGPQGDAAIACPDRFVPAQSAITALLAAYAAVPVGSLSMEKAYEQGFGAVVGYEAGLLARTGLAGSAMLSISTKTAQAFAHVACGLSGNAVCIPDPTPHAPNYAWSDYYFALIVGDLMDAASGSAGYQSAIQGFNAACRQASCSPDAYSLTPDRFAIVWTGLAPPAASPPPPAFRTLLTCWLNNTDPAAADPSATLKLYSTPTEFTTATIVGPGTLTAWQTVPNLGTSCGLGARSGYQAGLNGGVGNGGQFIEIETDAAAEPQCTKALTSVLGTLLAGNPQTGCL